MQMNKNLVIFGISILLLTMGLTGCINSTESNYDDSANSNSKSTTNYSSKVVSVNRNSEDEIEEVCIEIQNTGDNGAWFVADFEFTLLDWENVGPGIDGGGSTDYYDDPETYNVPKQAYVDAHKTKKVYCSPLSGQGFEISWDYKVYLE